MYVAGIYGIYMYLLILKDSKIHFLGGDPCIPAILG